MNKKHLAIGVLFICLGFSNLVFSGLVEQPLFKLVAFFMLVMVPGNFLTSLFKIGSKGRQSFALGLGLTFLMIVGLILNLFLPLLGKDEPLRLVYLLPTIDISIITLGTLTWLRSRKAPVVNSSYINIKFSTISRRTYLIVALYIIAPFISAAGAIRLNNGADNSLVVGLVISLVVLWIITLLWKHDKDKLYPLALYSSALSLLLMFSLRSNYVSGYDIQSELYIFKLTALNYHWLPGSASDAYNATLSLTILPTIFKELLHINFDTVFKLYYPLLAASMGSLVYLFARNFLQEKWAFMVALFFMVQPEFMQGVPALNRQEIALIFFLLILNLIFKKDLGTKIRKTLFVLLGFSMIVSHYSTAYVCLAALLIAYAVSRILIQLSLLSKQDYRQTYPSGRILIILFIGVLFWYGQISGDVKNLNTALNKAAHNLTHITSAEQRSNTANQVLGGDEKSNTASVAAYRHQLLEDSEFPKNTDTSSMILPAQPVQIKTKDTILSHVVTLSSDVAQKAFKVLLFVGLALYCYRLFRQRSLQSYQIILLTMALSFLVLAIALVFLPSISQSYNFERLYQQALPIFTVLMAMGALGLMVFLRFSKYASAFFMSLIIVYFLSYVGVLVNFTGGNPTMQLTNFGDAYSRFYKHGGEVQATQWISMNRSENDVLSADAYGAVKLHSIYLPETKVLTNVTHESLNKNALVFMTSANLNDHIAYAKYKNSIIMYTFPQDLISNTKSLVYTNSDSQIYK